VTLLEDITAWKRELGLYQWEIALAETPPDEGYAAQIIRQEDECYAEIRVDDSLTPEQTKRAIVHEMLHLVMLPVDRTVTFPTYADGDRYGHAQEVMLNQLATALTGIEYAPD